MSILSAKFECSLRIVDATVSPPTLSCKMLAFSKRSEETVPLVTILVNLAVANVGLHASRHSEKLSGFVWFEK
jgi:hypothetical protein